MFRDERSALTGKRYRERRLFYYPTYRLDSRWLELKRSEFYKFIFAVFYTGAKQASAEEA